MVGISDLLDWLKPIKLVLDKLKENLFVHIALEEHHILNVHWKIFLFKVGLLHSIC